MLAHILGFTNRGKRDYKPWQGFQIGAGITNRDSLRDFKSGQRLQIGARETANRGRDFKSGQGLQIGAEHIPEVFVR